MMSKDNDKLFNHFFAKSNKPVPKAQVEKLMLVKRLYDELGTLQKVADRMSLTRERVRQLLNKGEEYNIYEYEPHGEERFRKLVGQFSRDILIKEIKMLIWPTKVGIKLNLSQSQLSRLLEYYNIDWKDYHDAARAGSCLEEYSKIVDFLGHHPSTTEMNTNPKWRNLWMKIDRIWGTFSKFRDEYGIERPDYRVHPNTLKAFGEYKILMSKQKTYRKKQVIEILTENKVPMSASKIAKSLGFKRVTLNIYLRELIEAGNISRIGRGCDVQYLAKR